MSASLQCHKWSAIVLIVLAFLCEAAYLAAVLYSELFLYYKYVVLAFV